MRVFTHYLLHILLAGAPIILLEMSSTRQYVLSRPSLGTFLAYLPYFLFLTTLGLSHLLRQTRLMFTAAYLMLSYFLLVHIGSLGGEVELVLPLSHRITALAVATPMSLALISIFGESRIMSRTSVFRLLAAFLPLALAFFLVFGQPAEFRMGIHWVIFPGLPFWYLPHVSIILMLLYLTIFFFYRDPYLKTFNFTLLFALIPFYYALNSLIESSDQPEMIAIQAGVICTFTGVLMVHGVMRIYWQKIYLDELTQIPNRRALNEALPTLGKDYCVAMVDIDHFKKFNDNYGHSEGDNALRYVAKHLERELNGRVYRYGGEEFCVLMKKTKTTEASKTLDGIRQRLAEQLFHIRSTALAKAHQSKEKDGNRRLLPRKLHITVSVGVAARKSGHSDPEEVIKSADQALYVAKGKGRNCVVVA